MDYKQKYKEALERAKDILKGYNPKEGSKATINYIFPELKESEDERIRKRIIQAIKIREKEMNEEWSDEIAWIEKQNSSNKEYWRGYKDGKKTILDRYSELKTQNKQKPIVIIPKFRVGDEIITENEESLTITRIDEEGYWSNDLFICGFNDSDEWELVEQKPYGQREECLDCQFNYTGKCKGYCAMKRSERNLINKEPKFKVGNWYQCTKDFFGKGVIFNKNTTYYCAEEGCLQDEYGCHIAIVKDLYDNFKLWTIQDAKDGDVLVCDKEILLFKSYSEGCISLYCWYNGHTNNFHSKEVDDTLLTTRNKICPATKEQRETLEKAMADTGWEFDFEKKELKKIEQEIVENSAKVSESSSEEKDMCEYKKGFEYGKQRILKYPEDFDLCKKSVWSEEDESMYTRTLGILGKCYMGQLPTKVEEELNWFKTLKERIGG